MVPLAAPDSSDHRQLVVDASISMCVEYADNGRTMKQHKRSMRSVGNKAAAIRRGRFEDNTYVSHMYHMYIR
jgi:hypothetical protein